ncbi:hypothetical protein [Pontibacter actiniarum]|uniref:Uncharacterized protein n=1 Tax=Pontibacter actiniarum TaxID=323450 RepID=A0A1X9YRK7_9BACT|nr:hypothetical protein [Pontibacter actiniarum]ARS35516.1 hypothetical protein CA264_08735 [Pontibacter actiniarum]
MIKAFLKYLLSLSVLLGIVYGQLYVPTYQELSRYAAAENSLQGSVFASLGSVQEAQIAAPKYSSYNLDKDFSIEATDGEDDSLDFVALKKLLSNNPYFTSLLYALALAYFICFVQASLRFCKHFFSKLSHKRYLLLQVFRI